MLIKSHKKTGKCRSFLYEKLLKKTGVSYEIKFNLLKIHKKQIFFRPFYNIFVKNAGAIQNVEKIYIVSYEIKNNILTLRNFYM